MRRGRRQVRPDQPAGEPPAAATPAADLAPAAPASALSQSFLAEYAAWRPISVAIHDHHYSLLTKPGALVADGSDPAMLLLAATLVLRASDRLLILNAGSGLVGAVAARQIAGTQLVLTDANLIHVEASRRTLAANGVTEATVVHSQGLSHYQPDHLFDVVAMRLPKGRLPVLQLIADAWRVLRPGGRLYLAGGKQEGILSAIETAAAGFGQAATLLYRKGYRIGVAVKQHTSLSPDLDWPEPLSPQRPQRFSVELVGRRVAVCTFPGLFAWQGVDAGTRALIEAMAIEPGQSVLDLGCGHGVAGVVAAYQARPGLATLIDVDIMAVEAARLTAAANGLDNVTVLASDGLMADASPNGISRTVAPPFDRVIANPPFHVGQATIDEVAHMFIHTAASILQPGGRLYLVANRFLPYEAVIQAAFGNIATVFADHRYKVLMAELPNPPSG